MSEEFIREKLGKLIFKEKLQTIEGEIVTREFILIERQERKGEIETYSMELTDFINTYGKAIETGLSMGRDMLEVLEERYKELGGLKIEVFRKWRKEGLI